LSDFHLRPKKFLGVTDFVTGAHNPNSRQIARFLAQGAWGGPKNMGAIPVNRYAAPLTAATANMQRSAPALVAKGTSPQQGGSEGFRFERLSQYGAPQRAPPIAKAAASESKRGPLHSNKHQRRETRTRMRYAVPPIASKAARRVQTTTRRATRQIAGERRLDVYRCFIQSSVYRKWRLCRRNLLGYGFAG